MHFFDVVLALIEHAVPDVLGGDAAGLRWPTSSVNVLQFMENDAAEFVAAAATSERSMLATFRASRRSRARDRGFAGPGTSARIEEPGPRPADRRGRVGVTLPSLRCLMPTS